MRVRKMNGDGICHADNVGGGTAQAVTISAPVGAGALARNLRADVIVIQNLLNRIGPERGGPDPKLAPDGICGTKTKAAILRFQSARMPKPDGRVDPKGPTLRIMVDLASSLPSQVSNARGQLGTITGVITAARAALQLAKFSLDRGGNGGFVDFGAGVIAKLNKHFHLDKHPNARGAVDSVDKVYFDMLTSIGFVPQGVTLFEDDPTGDDGFAFCTTGGQTIERRVEIAPNNGVPVSSGTIFLCAALRQMDDVGVAYIMVHELAHYVGPIPDATCIDDIAHHLSPRYKTLTSDQALRNAESYAQFAFDAANRPFNHLQHSNN